MESEKSATKRSFFREYFFYKLRGTLGICIASAVVGLITCVLSSFSLYTMVKETDSSGYSSIGTLCIFAMFAGLVGMAVIAIIAPIVSFKYYRSRNSMDTLGCLPITYGQRFCGDFISGLAAIVFPFSVAAAIGAIFLTMVQPIINSSENLKEQVVLMDCAGESVLMFGVKMYLVMLIIIVAAYSITTLVTSCCGKAGSSALYSVIALSIIPAVIGLYGIFTLDFAKGILPEQQINTILSCFPPVGTFIYLTLGMGSSNVNYGGDNGYSVFPNVTMVIVSLLFIAVMIAAAYLIGKCRKPERTGNGFVVTAMYHILTLLLVVAVIGVYFSVNKAMDTAKIFIGAVIVLVFYLILELIQYRNFKRIWKSLIHYVCVAVVGFGFLIIAMKTNGFGIGNHLPKQSDIMEITIESCSIGNLYDGGVGTVKYRAEDAITAILDANKQLIDNQDKIYTGAARPVDNGINLTYGLKNGKSVSRFYSVPEQELFNNVVEEIKKQPTYEIKWLGVLNCNDFTGIKMTFRPHNENAVEIKDSKIPELVERLKYDIINGERDDNKNAGTLVVTLPDGEEEELITDSYYTHFLIDKSYTRTVEFLNNPDNFNNKPDTPANDVKMYRVQYNAGISEGEPLPTITSAEAKFRSDSDSKYAKELMSYFVSGTGGEERTDFYVRTFDAESEDYLNDFFIPKDKRQAALKALLNLIAEQNESIQ